MQADALNSFSCASHTQLHDGLLIEVWVVPSHYPSLCQSLLLYFLCKAVVQ